MKTVRPSSPAIHGHVHKTQNHIVIQPGKMHALSPNFRIGANPSKTTITHHTPRRTLTIVLLQLYARTAIPDTMFPRSAGYQILSSADDSEKYSPPTQSTNRVALSTFSGVMQTFCAPVREMKARRKARRHNMKCPLLRLPDLILVEIMETHLREAALMALRRTCRTLARLVKDELGILDVHELRKDSKDEASLIVNLLARDIFPRLPPNVPSSWLMCSTCRCPQPRRSFHPEERDKPPYVRCCRGAARTLEICSHLRLNFSELKTVLAKSLTETGIERIECPHEHPALVQPENFGIFQYNSNSQCEDQLPPFTLLPCKPPRERPSCYNRSEAGVVSTQFEDYGGSWYEVATFRVIMSLWNTEPTAEAVARVLERCEDLICPHVRVSDPAVSATYGICSRTSKWPLLDHHNTETDPRTGTYCCRNRIGRCGRCRTTFVVRVGFRFLAIPPGEVWSSQPVQPIVWLETRRKLGNLFNACDPTWLAQTCES